jgi:hypothetical protein
LTREDLASSVVIAIRSKYSGTSIMIDEAYEALQVGQRVAFEVVESDRKPGYSQCINIDVIKN